MAITNDFPYPILEKWSIHITSYDTNQFLSIPRANYGDNAYRANAIQWDQETGAFLKSGDGITKSDINTLKTLSQSDYWVWFDEKLFGKTAYFVSSVASSFKAIIVYYTKMATIEYTGTSNQRFKITYKSSVIGPTEACPGERVEIVGAVVSTEVYTVAENATIPVIASQMSDSEIMLYFIMPMEDVCINNDA